MMRPAVLDHGYRPATRLLFALIRLFSGHPPPDAAKLVFYRPAFYGRAAKSSPMRRCADPLPGRSPTGS